MPQKTIEAVVEIRPYEATPPWPIAAIPDPSLLRLFSGVTDEEIGTLILTACSYNQIDVQSSPAETLNAFVAEDFVLPGGLRFSEAGRVKIVPGCCCGLEEWRDWLDVPNGETVWAGHDPQPGVEFIDGIIRVWRDEKAEAVEFVDLGVDEMRNLLKEVESDLNGFLFRLGEWTDSVAPELKAAVVEHFAKNMDIIENPNRIDTARFFELVLADFPELKEKFAEDKGLFHLQIATFSRVAKRAIERGDFTTLVRCYEIVDEVMKSATPYVENAVYVSFLEHLEFKLFPNGAEARRLLPPKLAKMLVELEEHFQKLWEAQQRDR